jgi:hypothetical protein
VNVADNADLDPLPTRWGYAVFGRVVEGMEVVDRISVSPTGSSGPFKQDAPLAPVVIHKVEIVPDTSPVPSPSPTPAPAATSSGEPAPAQAPGSGAGVSAKPSEDTMPVDPAPSSPPPK